MGGREEKKPGRRAFQPTEVDRARVRDLAGKPLDVVAAAIGVSIPTLRKHFAAELAEDRGPELTEAADPVAPPSRKPGRKAFKPTPYNRRDVTVWAGQGMGVAAIARVLGISEPTLRKHFAAELETAEAVMEAKALTALDRMVAKGSVSAAEKMMGLIERARLARLQDQLDDRAERNRDQAAEGRVQPPGKKLQAKIDADQAAGEGEWGRLIRPH